MLLQINEGVHTITLHRDPLNTLDLPAVLALSDLFQNHPDDAPLVLTGANAVFCAGVDAKAFAAYAPAQRLDMARAITQMAAHLLAIKSPVIAAIPGHALGGGLVLALCCDYRVASDAPEAKYGLFEAKAGIAFPSGPALIVQRELPAPILRRLTLSCHSMSAADLLRHMVFDDLAPPDRLHTLAHHRARELAGLSGFGAVKAQMRAELAAAVKALADAGRETAFEPA